MALRYGVLTFTSLTFLALSQLSIAAEEGKAGTHGFRVIQENGRPIKSIFDGLKPSTRVADALRNHIGGRSSCGGTEAALTAGGQKPSGPRFGGGSCYMEVEEYTCPQPPTDPNVDYCSNSLCYGSYLYSDMCYGCVETGVGGQYCPSCYRAQQTLNLNCNAYCLCLVFGTC